MLYNLIQILPKIMRRKNFSYIIKNPIAITAGIIAGGLMSRLLWSFTDLILIEWNEGKIIMYTEIVFHILFAVLFSIFIAATTYKWNYMKSLSGTNSGKGLIGSFLWTLVAGCPSCTITVASYIGLASAVSLLPRWWLELKIIGLGLMIRSIYDTIKNLHTCSLKKPKN